MTQIELPDIRKYYWACQLTRVVDWNVHASTKAWIHIEQAFSHMPLKQLPWTATIHIPQCCKQHPFIGNILRIFTKMCHQFKISTSLGPLTPVYQNPEFPLGMGNNFLLHRGSHSDLRTGHFFSNATLIPRSTLTTILHSFLPGRTHNFIIFLMTLSYDHPLRDKNHHSKYFAPILSHKDI